jgi:hypothetical protein
MVQDDELRLWRWQSRTSDQDAASRFANALAARVSEPDDQACLPYSGPSL